MHLEAVELVRCELPFLNPFRTSTGERLGRDVVLVHVLGRDADGWGEDVAESVPFYAAEFVEASVLALRHHLIPQLLAARDVTAYDVARVLSSVRGWEMAKAALEMAVLDAELRAQDQSMGAWLGGTRSRISAGVSVGLFDDVDQTVAAVAGFVAQGYARVKLKIEPGRDVEVVRAVRHAVGPKVLLQVDANGSYSLDDAAHLAQLDAFDLLMIEDPLEALDLHGHARLAAQLATPICLDEGITSVRLAREALDRGACSILNIKPGRMGGLLEARRLHDLCVAEGVPVWCGGMLETGVGRAANLALASLPGFVLPPDLSASSRYFRTDLTEPFELVGGCLEVPQGPGLGVTPRPEVLETLGARTERFGA